MVFVLAGLRTMADQPKFVIQNANSGYNLSSFTPLKQYENIEKLRSVNTQSDISHPDFGKVAPRRNPSLYEQYSKRTATSSNFIKEDGKALLVYSYAPINYLDKNGNYIAIDPRISSAANGWSAPHQQFPTFLNTDASTELSLSTGGADRLKFNFNSSIAGNNLSLKNFTVGDDGMMIHDAIAGVDKRIIFRENIIETDYVLNKPLTAFSGDLVISEEIIVPAGYSIKEKKIDKVVANRLGYRNDTSDGLEMVVENSNGVECAHFEIPFCYDSNKDSSNKQPSLCNGKYELRTNDGRTFLDVIIPAARPKDTTPGELSKTAERVVKRLKDDLTDKKPETN